MTTTKSSSSSGGTTSERRAEELRVELRVRPAGGRLCPLVDSRDGGSVVDQNVVCSDGSCTGGCECRAAVETEEGVGMVGRTVDAHCVCPVFNAHDCVSTIEAYERGELVVSLWVPSRDQLAEIVEGLRERDAEVELRSITRSAPEADGRQITIEADSITEKQREAIDVAFEAGYYDTPKGADLDDLADELGVSPSAVSQRLSAAESTLLRSLHEVIGTRPD